MENICKDQVEEIVEFELPGEPVEGTILQGLCGEDRYSRCQAVVKSSIVSMAREKCLGLAQDALMQLTIKARDECYLELLSWFATCGLYGFLMIGLRSGPPETSPDLQTRAFGRTHPETRYTTSAPVFVGTPHGSINLNARRLPADQPPHL